MNLVNSLRLKKNVLSVTTLADHRSDEKSFWLSKTPHERLQAVAALREFGLDVPELTPGLFLKEGQIIRVGVPPVRIEIATGISGVKFEDCYAARTVDELDGVKVNLIGLEHLKENKRASGRSVDLNDLENLP